MARDAQSWDDETAVMQRLKDVGVLVSGGRGYHGPETEVGWMRVGFAIEKPRLEEALSRAERIYDDSYVANDGEVRDKIITRS